jgi:hypothetical protein
MGRWIDVARRQVARGEGRRYKAPTRLQIVTERYNVLQAQKDNPRDLLCIDRTRRRRH